MFLLCSSFVLSVYLTAHLKHKIHLNYMYKISVPTSRKTLTFLFWDVTHFRKITAVFCETHTRSINELWWQK
jgi:hypothetical protein